MPKIDIARLPTRDRHANYPAPFKHGRAKAASKTALGNAAGLTQFGVNLTRLKPGAASALRHWHEKEDEFVYMLEGELVLIEDDGETMLQARRLRGLQGRRRQRPSSRQPSQRDAVYLEIGTRAPSERAHYPDVDLIVRTRRAAACASLHKNGEPY